MGNNTQEAMCWCRTCGEKKKRKRRKKEVRSIIKIKNKDWLMTDTKKIFSRRKKGKKIL